MTSNSNTSIHVLAEIVDHSSNVNTNEKCKQSNSEVTKENQENPIEMFTWNSICHLCDGYLRDSTHHFAGAVRCNKDGEEIDVCEECIAGEWRELRNEGWDFYCSWIDDYDDSKFKSNI